MAPAASRFLPSPMTATAPVARPLHPVGTTQHSGRTVCSKVPVSLSLDPIVQVPNPYGGLPVELQQEVVSTGGDLALVMRRSSHVAILNDYFVCSLKGVPVWLPPLPAAEVFLPRSMGLLDCRDGTYLVAHLSVTHNQNTGFITEGRLHLCKYNASSSSCSPWTHASVNLSRPHPRPNLTNWHNHRVIPFNGTDLMWVDLNQGILHMSLSDGKPPSVQFFDLPDDLSSISKYGREDRPEMIRSVGCCNGKVQLVNLHIPDANTVAVNIWTLELKNGEWSKDYDNVRLICGDLWRRGALRYRTTGAEPAAWAQPHRNAPHRPTERSQIWCTLPPWPNSVPIFPFLREDNNSTILCLTVVEQKNKAWLLQIDMRTSTLKDVTEYPRYYSHMKQPFLINSGKMILWPL